MTGDRHKVGIIRVLSDEKEYPLFRSKLGNHSQLPTFHLLVRENLQPVYCGRCAVTEAKEAGGVHLLAPRSGKKRGRLWPK